ncbi:DUF6496 domain-containing protein [Paraburkholderia sp. BL25I1N1]|uniref:DUF6496 domain-containing protein n=1 Tax=Paraburkholderia sp. BL25I1N1 TaxID=1938804 RepID=UPI000D04939D|nr:DUF6496 domain-containing protein [Paraburkholderia sp. BL25I1N1]PRY09181.1 hypothetical protein B0G73_10187 [Paraburkholderia sp. BL25I1N1]
MPEKKTIERAKSDKRAGKASSTQAGEFVKEQVDKVRAGKHGVRSAKQAIAIGLSEARRAGVAVKSPKKGTASEATRKKAATDNAAGQHKSTTKKSTESTAKRSRAATDALKREGTAGASRTALSKQTKTAAAKRPAASRSAAAKKAAATKGAAGRSAAAKKAAQTRASRTHH